MKVVVAHGVENAHTVMEQLKAGKLNDVAFIEIMCCPGGCVTGGGQPIQPAEVRNNIDLKAERAKALYNADKKAPLRKSHDNARGQGAFTRTFWENPTVILPTSAAHTLRGQKQKAA